MITTTNEIYELVEMAMHKCRQNGYDDAAQQLEDAMHLGSSGLEILGAIKETFISQAATLEKVMDKKTVHEVVMYANKAFGIECKAGKDRLSP